MKLLTKRRDGNSVRYKRVWCDGQHGKGEVGEVMSLLGNVGSDLVAEYEKLAEKFYKETGYMAPGKDRPGPPLDYEDAYALLSKLWDAWQRIELVRAALRDIRFDEINDFREIRDDELFDAIRRIGNGFTGWKLGRGK